MNKMLLAVFGHYDSRGGTSAYVMNEATQKELMRLFYVYNDAFGFHEEVKQYEKDPSKWSWNPTEPGMSPADQDFLFVAELNYEGERELLGGDLEDRGAVIIDVATEEFLGKFFVQSKMNQEEIQGHWREHPIQLEFVPLEGGKYGDQQRQGEPDDDVWQKSVIAKMKTKMKRPEVRDWNDDAFGFLLITKED